MVGGLQVVEVQVFERVRKAVRVQIIADLLVVKVMVEVQVVAEVLVVPVLLVVEVLVVEVQV